MNYRHHFHAGNFADAMKHALLVQLVRALQKKEKGFLYLDTHAGRGRYDLERAATGDSLARKPEWPEGVGRLTGSGRDGAAAEAENPVDADAKPLAVLEDYLALVRDFDREAGNLDRELRFYPGSPWVVRRLARLQDRLALCEKHPAECGALRADFAGRDAVAVHEMDGYTALRAMLPPPERRALVLIDPPFEAQDEFAQIADGLADGLRRFPSGVFAVWYPLTERARVEEFFVRVRELNPPPTLACELEIAGPQSQIKMKGCGLMVINTPWQFEKDALPLLAHLAEELAQAPGGRGRVEWVVGER